MSQKSREQSQRKESQEHASTERDEHDEPLTPDIDFPEPSTNPGAKES